MYCLNEYCYYFYVNLKAIYEIKCSSNVYSFGNLNMFLVFLPIYLCVRFAPVSDISFVQDQSDPPRQRFLATLVSAIKPHPKLSIAHT